MADLPAALVARLFQDAGASRWGLTEARFARALARSLPDLESDAVAAGTAGQTLHVADLALATACIDGVEPAWEHFVGLYTPVLRRAADAMDPTGAARELADGLFGDLFAPGRDGRRPSLLEHFHGRSSLATWLRAVLSRRYVDVLRASRRVEPLPESDVLPAAPARAPLDAGPGRERADFLALMRAAVRAAVAALTAGDRLRLACYYAQGLSLSQIGRLLGEHEATASRHLSRARQAVRRDVERQLTAAGLSPQTIAECVASVAADAGTLDLGEWLHQDTPRKLRLVARSTEETKP